MDPEKTLTFCLGLKAEEMTMSLKGLDGTEASTVAVPQKEADLPTVYKVVKHHGSSGSQPVVNPKYCPGVNSNAGYLCVTGHCCGETGCCTYYYELWWFWLLWTVLILFSCFCAYRHRRAKLRIQQQQRQREINLIAYNGACNYPSSMLDLSFLASFKLPSYEEVAAQPTTPPPPYSSVFALQGGAMLGPSSSYPHHHHPYPLQSHPCPPYLGPGPSSFTSSQSSDNYTSCSCESCSCSTSFSVQVTDETYDSSRMSTPSDAGGDGALPPRVGATRVSPPPSQAPPDVIPAVTPDVIPSHASNGNEGLSRPAAPVSLPLRPLNNNFHPRHPLSPLILLSSLPAGQVQNGVFSDPLGATLTAKEKEPEGPAPSSALPPDLSSTACPVEQNLADEDEEDEEEDHFSHRRLTGDSGIEVCRCHVKRGDREEEAIKERRESMDSSLRAKGAGLSPALDNCAQLHDCAPSPMASS
ncbi:WW domain binding protein 1-like isoform X1 [Entelurus aequoreus]|uniref:WW domain binding protein 1-like isoform X1 n=1 Tax=Entelurus aequoreus TaxID=161455 RepID=UPI002B1D30C7|nr:WW domain binding protein 1-like isoform X1 [Entelurus aequoreus]